MTYDSKSHVGMDMCFWCGECKQLLLDRRLKNSLEQEAVYSMEPCDTCKGNMAKGITLMASEDGINPTGAWCVITEEGFKRMGAPDDMVKDVLEKRKCFLEPKLFEKVMQDGTGPETEQLER